VGTPSGAASQTGQGPPPPPAPPPLVVDEVVVAVVADVVVLAAEAPPIPAPPPAPPPDDVVVDASDEVLEAPEPPTPDWVTGLLVAQAWRSASAIGRLARTEERVMRER
jgi:hypothetical protein